MALALLTLARSFILFILFILNLTVHVKTGDPFINWSILISLAIVLTIINWAMVKKQVKNANMSL